jgi:hypothetical protein
MPGTRVRRLRPAEIAAANERDRAAPADRDPAAVQEAVAYFPETAHNISERFGPWVIRPCYGLDRPCGMPSGTAARDLKWITSSFSQL